MLCFDNIRLHFIDIGKLYIAIIGNVTVPVTSNLYDTTYISDVIRVIAVS